MRSDWVHNLGKPKAIAASAAHGGHALDFVDR